MSTGADLFIQGCKEYNDGELDRECWESYSFAYLECVYELAAKATGVKNPLKYSVHVHELEVDDDVLIEFFGITEDEFYDDLDTDYWGDYLNANEVEPLFDATEVYESLTALIGWFEADPNDSYECDHDSAYKEDILEDLRAMREDVALAKSKGLKVRVELG